MNTNQQYNRKLTNGSKEVKYDNSVKLCSYVLNASTILYVLIPHMY